MKFMFAIILLILSSLAMANEMKVEVNPPKPVAGEVFQAYFRIFTESDDEPAINFSPYNVEVVGKSTPSISIKTIYSNGNLTTSREITVVYDLVSPKTGSAALRDIQAQVAGKTIRHPTINLNILKEPQEIPEVFVMADVPKTRIFLGEGITVRYYLYSKVNVNNLDIKSYPKLNHFLKRFLQENPNTENVTVDGQLFTRSNIYSARLYPEKVGELKIDPLRLSATVRVARPGDPFGVFGGGAVRNKTVSSDPVKVEVLPLPQPVPPHFTGLVGKHDFDLTFGQSKLIVNEPLEVKLIVNGVGALENLEAPTIIKHNGLEEFETNGDLKISSPELATKTFDYTYLAKENLNLPSKQLTLSYLDPVSGKYVPVQLDIPEIVVAGGQAKSQKDDKTPVKEQKPETKAPAAPVVKDLAGPVTVDEWQWKNVLPVVNFSLAGLAVLLSLGWMIKFKGFSGIHFKNDVPAAFKKDSFEFGEFVKWMTPLIKQTGKSPLMIIKDSPLPEESKRYFIDLLSANDYKEYSSRKGQMDYKYQAAHFKHLSRYIESVGNESSSQPS